MGTQIANNKWADEDSKLAYDIRLAFADSEVYDQKVFFKEMKLLRARAFHLSPERCAWVLERLLYTEE